MDYIKEDDIEVAIKSIAFDNTQSIHIIPKLKQPHFMIVQEITEEREYIQFMRTVKNNKGETSGVGKFLKGEKTIEEIINIDESKDFVIINNCDGKQIIVQSHLDREFSNIIFISNNRVIHHIYMHHKECFYLDTFINHVNSVLKLITFYHDNAKIETDLVQNEYEIHSLPFRRILVHDTIAETLGVYTEKKSATKLLDYFINMQGCINDSPPTTLFMDDVYKFEQELVYYDISNTPLRVQPKLFQSTLYGIRSNISDPTIRNAQYDTLVGVFQDNRKQDVKNYYHNLDANKNKQEIALGSPTYIHVVVKPAPIRMKRPFTIFWIPHAQYRNHCILKIQIQIF